MLAARAVVTYLRVQRQRQDPRRLRSCLSLRFAASAAGLPAGAGENPAVIPAKVNDLVATPIDAFPCLPDSTRLDEVTSRSNQSDDKVRLRRVSCSETDEVLRAHFRSIAEIPLARSQSRRDN